MITFLVLSLLVDIITTVKQRLAERRVRQEAESLIRRVHLIAGQVRLTQDELHHAMSR